MKSFKEFLGEMAIESPMKKTLKAPLGKDVDAEQRAALKSRDGSSYDAYFKKIHNRFEEAGGIGLSQGSARRAYKVPVGTKLFSVDELKQLNAEFEVVNADMHDEIAKGQLMFPGIKFKKFVRSSSPTVNTIIKVALNIRGIVQNQDEANIWMQYKDQPESAKWLCPIIDTSANVFNTKDEGKGLLFVQMPVCDVDNAHEWSDIYFGKDMESLASLGKSYNHNPDGVVDHIKNAPAYNHLTQEQADRCMSFAYFIAESGIMDVHGANIAWYGTKETGRPVIIDYAFAVNESGDSVGDTADMYRAVRRAADLEFKKGDVKYKLR